MLLTALPPAPPTPTTVILGLSSCVMGKLRLMVICFSSTGWPTVFGSGHVADRGQVAGLANSKNALEVLSKPLSKSRKTVRQHRDLDLVAPAQAAVVAQHQRHGPGGGGAAGLVRAAARPRSDRPAAAGRQAEHLLDQFVDALELAAAAGDARSSAAGGQPAARHARRAAAAPGCKISSTRARTISVIRVRGTSPVGSSAWSPSRGCSMRVLSSQRAELRAAIQVLDPLGMLAAGRQTKGEVARDVVAAIGHLAHQGQPAAGEMGKTSSAAAQVEHQAAALELVLGEAADRRGVARRHHALDLEVAALEAGQEVAQGGPATVTRCATISSRWPVSPRASLSGVPPSMVTSTGTACSTSRSGARRLAARAVEQELEVGLAHAAAVQRAVHPHIARLRPAAADRQHDLPQGLAGLLLGLVQRRQDRGSRRPRRRRPRRP